MKKLKDLLENEVDEKYYLSETQMQNFKKKVDEKLTGDLCRRFKGNSLLKENIYEIIAVGVIYTGEGANKLLDN